MKDVRNKQKQWKNLFFVLHSQLIFQIFRAENGFHALQGKNGSEICVDILMGTCVLSIFEKIISITKYVIKGLLKLKVST